MRPRITVVVETVGQSGVPQEVAKIKPEIIVVRSDELDRRIIYVEAPSGGIYAVYKQDLEDAIKAATV